MLALLRSMLVATVLAACTAGRTTPADEAAAPPADGALTPIALAATPGDGMVHLRWQMPPGKPVRAFHVLYRAQLPGPPWTSDLAHEGASPILVEGDTTLAITGLSNGITVWFAVAAVHDDGPGPASEPVKATPSREAHMVLVPAGAFTRGAAHPLAPEDQLPAQEIYLDAFLIDRWPTTNAEYRACVDAGACPPPARASGFIRDVTLVADYFEDPLYDGYPVVYLEWGAAAAFCAYRGARLPTEAEWEKAARGTDPERRWPWGSEPPTCELSSYSADGQLCVGGAAPVGSWPGNVSPYGVREMAGNVWEWTADWYAPDAYASAPCRNPRGPVEGAERVLRGGAWYYPEEALGVAYRNHWPPTFTLGGDPFGDYRGFGVRCARDAESVPCDPSTADCVADGPCVHPSWGGEPDAGVTDTAEADADADAGAGPDAAPDGQGDGCSEPSDPPPGACFSEDAAPACPSGWPEGCEAKACACCEGIGVEPLVCSEPSLDLELVRPYGGAALGPGAEIEICEGFQGGTHLGVVVRAPVDTAGPGPQILAVRVEVLALGVPVACYRKDKLAASVVDDALETPPLQVRFEPCAGVPAGQPLRLRVRVEDSAGRWGLTELELMTTDLIEGPTTAEGDGC